MDRRNFLKVTTLAGFSVSLLGIVGCEENTIEPKFPGQAKDFITKKEDFFVQFGNGTAPEDYPKLTKANWNLQIKGLVNTEKTFTFADLEALKSKETTFLKTMRCVFDAGSFEKYIANAYWTGISLKNLLEQAGVKAEAKRLRIFGADGFTTNILLSDVLEETPEGELPIILAYKMNGEDLTQEHGFPVRIIFPEKFGYKNMKWVSEIELTDIDEPFGKYEVDYGIFDSGDLQPISYISAPLLNEELKVGTYTIFGTALAGKSPVKKVEVKIDSGDWKEAEITSLDAVEFDLTEFTQNQAGKNPEDFIEQFKNRDKFSYPFKNVWVVWKFPFEVSGTGEITISARVTGEDGFVQPETDETVEDGNTTILSVKAKKI
ncbi:molybdopterin-dependent oxidoreductase [bacterium]|nr:molybdopterin-dependent oxidoreductase [bacterium]